MNSIEKRLGVVPMQHQRRAFALCGAGMDALAARPATYATLLRAEHALREALQIIETLKGENNAST